MSLFKSQAGPVEIEGKELKCAICGHDRFRTRKAQLNTAGAEFVNLGWANQAATCHACEKCGYVHWFAPQ